MKKFSYAFSALLLALSLQSARAAEAGFEIGGGAGINSLSGWDDATGFQVFGAYNFGDVAPKLNISVEAGFWDSGDFEINVPPLCLPGFPCVGGMTMSANATGLWATGRVGYTFHPMWEVMARAGFDAGDDDGAMFGAGIGFNINDAMQLRAEIVERQNISSKQLNFLYRFQ